MNWFDFISSMVGHLAWPTVVLLVVFWLRKGLTDFLKNISNLSGKGPGFEFSATRDTKAVEKLLESETKGVDVKAIAASAVSVEAKVIRANSSPPDNSPSRSSPEDTKVLNPETLLRLAVVNPRAAIDYIWKEVGAALSDVAKKVGIDPSMLVDITWFVDTLVAQGHISKATATAIDELAIIRNRAEYDRTYEISVKDVLSYWESAGTVIAIFRNAGLLTQRKNQPPSSETGAE